MRNLIKSLVLLHALSACSATAQHVEPLTINTPPAETELVPPPTEQQRTVLKPSWKITLPPRWEDIEDESNRFLARSLEKHGRLPIGIEVIVIDWSVTDDGPPDQFGKGVVNALLGAGEVSIMRVVETQIDGHAGTFLVMMLPGEIAAMQCAFATKTHAYVVRCAGDPDKELAYQCQAILETFHARQ